jgi:hypothetical protein
MTFQQQQPSTWHSAILACPIPDFNPEIEFVSSVRAKHYENELRTLLPPGSSLTHVFQNDFIEQVNKKGVPVTVEAYAITVIIKIPNQKTIRASAGPFALGPMTRPHIHCAGLRNAYLEFARQQRLLLLAVKRENCAETLVGMADTKSAEPAALASPAIQSDNAPIVGVAVAEVAQDEDAELEALLNAQAKSISKQMNAAEKKKQQQQEDAKKTHAAEALKKLRAPLHSK